ncbi:phosphotransferase [Streptomyces spiroverticillatus]|uniref:Phosphotransferase n=1 Tax=Streptomyces finlayi TaxID=67296 RepID=A0A918WXN9_9ACTN|nr:phosphotransferase [Streptomyces finlayi]GGZ92484.1 phosphotransferase [Streptomyces spiroverticillatus]GHC93056.1 phosphotransferase [Streptomyces finlayi]
MDHGHTETTLDLGDYAGTRTPWDDPCWQAQALGWAARVLREAGMREVPARARAVRIRPWSVLVRFRLEGGSSAWFKANPPASAFEAGLGEALARWVPEHVLHPYAVDVERGWALWPDGGTLFADVLDAQGDPHAWEEPLRQYATMQRALIPYADKAEALGVPSLRNSVLVETYERMVEACAALSAGERAAMLARAGQVADWCAELEGFGIPASLDHSDLHANQVFAPSAGHPDRYAFFDWGDAVVGHPFASLLVNARVARHLFGPEILPRLRDAYLEPWTGDGLTTAELHRAVSLACRLGAVSRAGAWGRLFPEAMTGDDGGADIARWLRELFAEPPY